jgi:hypothetical protein
MTAAGAPRRCTLIVIEAKVEAMAIASGVDAYGLVSGLATQRQVGAPRLTPEFGRGVVQGGADTPSAGPPMRDRVVQKT